MAPRDITATIDALDRAPTPPSVAPTVAPFRQEPAAETFVQEAVSSSSRWVASRTKRIADVVFVSVALLPATLTIAALATVSAVRFRAWPIFRQTRYGVDGRPFTLFKIRSLPTDWDPAVGKHDLDDGALPRSSRLLRHAHLDELPQLWNVLNGTMSLVGPRPMIEPVLERLPSHARTARSVGRPGLTGAWQISSMGRRPLEDCPHLDVEYVQHASAPNDLWILAATARGIAGRQPPSPAEVSRRLRARG